MMRWIVSTLLQLESRSSGSGRPLEKTQPNLDRCWLIYMALVAGGLLY